MAILGAALGLVGSISTKVFGIFEKKEERKILELRLQDQHKQREHEATMFTLQSQAKVAETEQEAFLMTVQGSYDGLKASINDQTETVKGSAQWVKNTLSMVRPSLTFIFVGIVAYVSIFENPDNYRAAAIAAAIELASMTVSWWFGDRSTKRVVESMRGGHIRGAGGNF